MSKVSVIIPVYNVEKYLRKCLDSVINQTLEDIEIICVNDGSTDNSGEILQEYSQKDSRIKLINKENGGLSSARNDAIKMAGAKYIGFVDSDDCISLNFYEKLYNAAEEYGADIAYSGIDIVTGKNIKHWIEVPKTKTAIDIYDKYKLAKFPYNCHVWNKIYNREKYLKTGIKFPLNVYYEDFIWSHKIFYYLGKMVTVPDCCYFYLNRDNSAVHCTSPAAVKNYKDAEYGAITFCQENNLPLNFLKSYCEKELGNRSGLFFTICYFGDNNYCWFLNKPLGNISFLNKIIPPSRGGLSIFERIFSIRNSDDKKYKIITIFGIKIKIKK